MRYVSFVIMLIVAVSLSNAQSPHGAKFSLDCRLCHNLDSWKVDITQIKFDHDATGFKLTGEHKNVSCKSCHMTLEFGALKNKTQCAGCHTDIHENTVGHFCEKCHTPNTWVVENINDIHRMSRFPLLGNHSKADCNQCHKSASNLKFEPLGIRCFDCHSSDYFAAKSPDHAGGAFSKDCEQCHNVSSAVWATSNVSHSFFPLVGGHALSNCFSCHKQNTYAGLTQTCYTCHQLNYMGAKSPDHMKMSFSTDCKQCHTLNPGWTPANFINHDSIYPLLGAHNNIRMECNKCHVNGYANTPTQCVGCHQTDYNNAVDPNHKSAGFSTDCAGCHSNNAWKPSTFDHDGAYFPIYSGKHAGQWSQCSDCHTDPGNYKVFACINCHEHSQSNTDSHHNGVNGYVYQSAACYSCHPRGTGEGVINHALTSFPLTGAHANVACQQCHQNGFANTPTDCVSCHQSNFNTAPNHTVQSYPQTCQQCHTTTDWKTITFNHSTTTFPLTGAHTTVTCQSCHVTKLAGIASDCYSCHQSNFAAAPNHTTQNYPHDCTLCHSTTSWQGSTFDHSKTAFPLTGAHTTTACLSCHQSKFAGTPTDCVSCHQSNFNTAPNHTIQSYPQTCQQCHTTTDWKTINFNHSTTTFPLTGAHTTVTCQSCHVTKLAGIASDCYSCHQSNFAAAPNHTAQNYPHDCTLCHSTASWQGSTFDHSKTAFPLTGAHTGVACASCHTAGYQNTPTVCYSCHQSNFQGTTNPNHVALNIPTTCEQCHTTTPGWKPATFPIHSNYWPLTGAHANIASQCASCHNGNYTTTPSQCVGCHQSDYNGAANPNHALAHFPTACEQCHTTSAWSPSTFNHDGQYFPIYSGTHKGRWSLCSDCHTNQTNFAVFSCITCHEHSQANSDSQHSGVRNYVYNATSCYSCHPTGQSN